MVTKCCQNNLDILFITKCATTKAAISGVLEKKVFL